MNARETLEKAVKVARGDVPNSWACLSERDRDTAELGVRRLIAAGFTIMSKEDVEAVRDKALEEACGAVDDPIKWHRALKSAGVRKNADLAHFTAGTAAAAIRSLKSTP